MGRVRRNCRFRSIVQRVARPWLRPPALRLADALFTRKGNCGDYMQPVNGLRVSATRGGCGRLNVSYRRTATRSAPIDSLIRWLAIALVLIVSGGTLPAVPLRAQA